VKEKLKEGFGREISTKNFDFEIRVLNLTQKIKVEWNFGG